MLTPGGDAWGIKRRFSAFKELRRSKEKDPSVTALPFPERVEAVAGKDSVDATASRQRQEQVQTWANALLGVCPGDSDLASSPFGGTGLTRIYYTRLLVRIAARPLRPSFPSARKRHRHGVCEH